MPKPKKTVEKTEEFVSKKDFDSAIGSITDLLKEVLAPKPEEVKTSEHFEAVKKEDERSTKPDGNYVPPKWRETVDNILGKDFGVNVSYPEAGAGFIFKIIVPNEKSNASKAYLDFYKTDVRSKSINNSDGANGVEEFCIKVAKNLGLTVKK